MPGIEEQAQSIVATAAEIARLQEAEPEAAILAQSYGSLLMTGSSDNYEQSIDLFTLTLEVPT